MGIPLIAWEPSWGAVRLDRELNQKSAFFAINHRDYEINTQGRSPRAYGQWRQCRREEEKTWLRLNAIECIRKEEKGGRNKIRRKREGQITFIVGSEEVYGVGASTCRRSGQVKVANVQLSPASRQHRFGVPVYFAPTPSHCSQFIMDDLYDESAHSPSFLVFLSAN